MRIGRVLGAEVRVHWVFLALFLMFALRDLMRGGFVAMAFSMAFLGLVFFCVFLHEVGHVYAGIRSGGRAEQILLWPLGGLAELHGVPSLPKPQIKVAVAGPLVNMALAAALLGVLALLNIDLLGRGSSSFGRDLLLYAFWANVIMFGFNLIPAFPLDGGTLLRWGLIALRPDRGYHWATAIGVKVGKVMAVLMGVGGLVLFSFFGNAILLLILAGVVYLACEREKRLLEYGAAMESLGLEPWQGASERAPSGPPKEPGMLARWKKRREMRKREREVRREVEVRKRVDYLLDKISREGMSALTEKEKAFLREASKRFQKNGSSR